MDHDDHSPLLASLVGHEVVVDFRSSYVCLGKLVGYDALFLDVHDADLHDFRDSPASREVYVYDSARVGIRRNRARVLVSRAEVVAITRFSDVAET
jgi:small nuclear ribonucleoprotein (snRNP)-like protein